MLIKEDMDLWAKLMDARHVIEEHYQWRHWGLNIPNLKFDSEWEVRIIPPFGGALARFNVIKDDKWVSIYLDGYDELGYVGEPYWEIYPNQHGDCSRHLMNDTEELMAEIRFLMEDNEKLEEDIF